MNDDDDELVQAVTRHKLHFSFYILKIITKITNSPWILDFHSHIFVFTKKAKTKFRFI